MNRPQDLTSQILLWIVQKLYKKYFRLISFQCCAPFKFNFIFLWTLHELHRLLRHKRLSSFLWRSSGKEAHKIAKNRISSIYSRLNLFGLRSFNSLIRLEDKLILFKVFFVVSFNASNLFLWCFQIQAVFVVNQKLLALIKIYVFIIQRVFF